MITMIRRRLDDESGLGMILVIGIMVFVAGLTVTASVISQNALGQSRQRINFERSLASAESHSKSLATSLSILRNCTAASQIPINIMVIFIYLYTTIDCILFKTCNCS